MVIKQVSCEGTVSSSSSGKRGGGGGGEEEFTTKLQQQKITRNTQTPYDYDSLQQGGARVNKE